MSLSLKLCLIVFSLYLCQFVVSYQSRRNSICTKFQNDATTGYRTKSVKYCCDGYTKNTRYAYTLICDPVCPNGCPNGRCVAPEVCYCDVGYTINPATFSCEPRCFKPCFNGDCIAPELCKCRPGFRKLNETYCEPIPPLCSPSCFNGDCVGPNKCQCHDGYELSGWVVGNGFDYTCLPHTTTSTTTTRAIITWTDDVEVEETSSETTTEASSSYRFPEVTKKDQVVTDQDETVTDQDASHRAEDAETITEPEFTTEDVNEVITLRTNITDGSMAVNVLLDGFTELDDNSLNDENTKNGTKMWIYISAAILLVALVIMLVVACRRRLLGYIKGRTYVVQGQETRRTSASSCNFNVTFSSISNGK